MMVEVQRYYTVAVEVQGHSGLAVEDQQCPAGTVVVWEQLDIVFGPPFSLSATHEIFHRMPSCIPSSFSAAQYVFLGPPAGIQTRGGVL